MSCGKRSLAPCALVPARKQASPRSDSEGLRDSFLALSNVAASAAALWIRSAPTAACRVSRIATRNHIGYTYSGGDQELSAQGARTLFANGSKRGIQAKHADRLRLILGRLNAATDPRDLNLPGLDLHELLGAWKGTWAVKVSGNWRITFSFADKYAERVDYEDYH
jgi:toxin HigB-1